MKVKGEDRRSASVLLVVACGVGTRTGDVPVQVLLPGIPAGALCGICKRQTCFGSRWGFSLCSGGSSSTACGWGRAGTGDQGRRRGGARESRGRTWTDERSRAFLLQDGRGEQRGGAASASVSAKGWGAGGASERVSLLTGPTWSELAGEGPDSAVRSESR